MVMPYGRAQHDIDSFRWPTAFHRIEFRPHIETEQYPIPDFEPRGYTGQRRVLITPFVIIVMNACIGIGEQYRDSKRKRKFYV